MSVIVVRSASRWPCALVKESEVPADAGDSSTNAVDRLESIVDGCDSVDEIHNALDEHGISYEEPSDVATAHSYNI